MIPDPSCMIAFLFDSSRKKHLDAYVQVELNGKHTRGMMIVDDSALPIGMAVNESQNASNTRFYTSIDMDIVKKAFYDICFWDIAPDQGSSLHLRFIIDAVFGYWLACGAQC